MTELDRNRLSRIAGLLASDKLGERAAAAAKATAILSRAGMTWEDALMPVQGPQRVIVVEADTSTKDEEIERLQAALAGSQARCRELLARLEAERSVFWMDADGKRMPWG